MKNLNKEQIKALIFGSVSIVLGILFCVLRLEMLGALETIACMALLIYGVIEVVIYCVVNTENREVATLLKGAFATAFALLIIFVGAVFVVCLGLVIVLSGVIYIKTAISDKENGESGWVLPMIIGAVLIVSGVAVAILYNTKIAANIVMTIFGITLIFDGVVRLVYVFLVHKSLHSLISKEQNSEDLKDGEDPAKTTANSDVIEPEFVVTNSENDNNEEKSEKKKKDKKSKPEIVENSVENDLEENEITENDGEADLSEDDDDGVEGFV